MVKQVNETDFYYPKKNFPCFDTVIRGFDYKYTTIPHNNTRLYGKDKSEVFDKLKEKNAEFRQYFAPKMTLKETFSVWVIYGKYDSSKQKDKLLQMTEMIEQYFIQNDKNNIFCQPFPMTTNKNLQDCIDAAIQLFDIRLAPKYYQDIIVFAECLKFLGLKINPNNLVFNENKKQKIIKKQTKTVISKKELKLFDNEVINNFKLQRSLYQEEGIIPIVVLHTGIFAKRVFLLKWYQIDLDKRIISDNGNQYPIDNVLFNLFITYRKKLKNNHDGDISPEDYLFESANRADANSYTGVLSTYQRIKKNCLITKDLSMRDLQLIKGKQLLDEGVSKEKVCSLLGITTRGEYWQKLTHFEIVEDDSKKNTEESDINPFLQNVLELTQDFTKEQKEQVISYISFLKMKG